jgi:hypothetical protein
MARFFAILLLFLAGAATAQPIDRVIGKKRARVQQDLRDLRILDYQRTQVEYLVNKGVRQTVIFKNDTCTAFFYSVTAERVPSFVNELLDHGYAFTPDSSLVREGVVLRPRALESGRAMLFHATTDATYEVEGRTLAKKTAQRQSGKKNGKDTERVRGPIVLPLPRMQQAAILEDADTTVKVKDPTRNWVGSEEGEVRVLGY